LAQVVAGWSRRAQCGRNRRNAQAGSARIPGGRD
jgi:hypothetical protein